MNFEVLKRSHVKRNILIGVMIVLILSAVILTFTKAKYRVTKSLPLVNGTINFSPYDFNVVAMYLNQGGAMPEGQTKIVPKFGYTLNQEQSACIVDDIEDERIIMNYVTQTADEEAYITFNKMSQSGTRCTVYFDLIPDSENPMIHDLYSSSDDTNITITVDANDNVGIYYYYFKLDNGDEIRLEENVYTFEGLTKDQTYKVTVRVEDAAGNTVSSSKEVTVGLTAKDVILASEGGAAAIEEKGSPDFEASATTDEGMYAAQDKYGTSYYYRGAVQDNWVSFEGFYWRIIRINGDGTIRMIYNGTRAVQTGANTQLQTGSFNSAYSNNMYVGYMYQSGQVHGLQQPSTIKGILDTWYQNNLASQSNHIEGNTGFCGDRTPYSGSGMGTAGTNYAAYNRLYTNKVPILTCANDSDLYTTSGSTNGNKALTYPIGLISADEVAMAGGVYGYANGSYYLYTGQTYWTMSPSSYGDNYAYVFFIYSDGVLSWSNVNSLYGVRPVINLKADTALSGSGTATDPYKVV